MKCISLPCPLPSHLCSYQTKKTAWVEEEYRTCVGRESIESVFARAVAIRHQVPSSTFSPAVLADEQSVEKATSQNL